MMSRTSKVAPRPRPFGPAVPRGSALPGQGLCENGISEHTGRAAQFHIKAAEADGEALLLPTSSPPRPAEPSALGGSEVEAGQSTGFEPGRELLPVPVLRAAEAICESQARWPHLSRAPPLKPENSPTRDSSSHSV